MSKLPECLRRLERWDAEPLPDTPVSEVIGLIKNSKWCRGITAVSGDLMVRILNELDDDLPGEMAWMDAKQLINDKKARIVIDDGAGGVFAATTSFA